MKDNRQDAVRRIGIYLVGVFGLSPVWWVIIGLVGVQPGRYEFLFVPLMWTPALVALVVTLAWQRNLRGLGWQPGQPVYYLMALALPVVYGLTVYGSAWLLGLGDIDTSALGDNFWLELLKILSVGLLFSLLFATGEEIGWRGLLVPQLARVHPFVRTALISGVIWGLWHIPVIIFGGYNSGTPLWYAIPCFLVAVTGMSFVYAWIRLASGSLWPAALLHGLHNILVQGVLDKITVNTGNTAYFTTEFGLLMAIAAVILAVIFWRIGVPAGLSRVSGTRAVTATGAG